ncbi:MAG TPA: RNA degradosome polyphosphate kinase [Candidatus Limnocylindrales bacterium]|nr:RNA degradosome polyphosphate kinase [Candidatus Limnocylindrales bacterium]
MAALRPTDSETEVAPTAVRAARSATRRRFVHADIPYINRELSWLDFNERVLHEAVDERNPLLERVRFLSIFAGNLDEFFQVRVAGLKQQLAAGRSNPTPDGMSAAETLDVIRTRLLPMVAQHSETWAELRAELATETVRIVRYEERPERHLELRSRFFDEIFPVLTPLAVDPGHPFPYISDLSLSLAVTVRDPDTGERLFARIKVPPILPRLMDVGRHTYVLLEQVIAANLESLFPGMEVLEHHLFRVTRNADLSIEEDEAPDLLMAIEEELRRRRFGKVVRLEIERSMPHPTRALLMRGLDVEPADVYEISGMLDLSALSEIAELDLPALQAVPWQPVIPPRLMPPDPDDEADVFAALREGDLLVHHPYESFAASVQRFIEQAADDPDVLTIKQTLYRTSGDSPIVRALISAAEAGKQVVVLVELKARFDERANIVWARALEKAGAHVAYGVVGLKTHSKVALVVRREGRGIRRYVHIGTGNYNSKTARAYVDLGLLTADADLGADITDLFNLLTGHSRQTRYRKLLVAPASLRSGILDRINAERDRQRSHGDGRIVMKCNAIVDPAVVAALYRASEAGVPIDLIVRGMCSVRPGVPELSETIRVRSIIGRYLEHSRILVFGTGERERFYIGSADMMERNLDRRVEAITPVSDPDSQARLRRILEVVLADDRRSWQLGGDDRWRRSESMVDEPTGLDTFEMLFGMAHSAAGIG